MTFNGPKQENSTTLTISKITAWNDYWVGNNKGKLKLSIERIDSVFKI